MRQTLRLNMTWAPNVETRVRRTGRIKMFCPRCGQPFNDEGHFCSRCGFLLDGVRLLLADDGALPILQESPRRRGVRHGAIVMLSGCVITPLLAVLNELMALPDALVAFAAVIFFVGGLMRILYALAFEPGGLRLPSAKTPVISSPPDGALSNRLPAHPPSVTDKTTKLFGGSEVERIGRRD